MSIVVYTGKPGSGKTYRVVKELLEDSGRYYVFHNIDGLKESLIEGGRFIQSWRDVPDFFTKAKQEEVSNWAREKHGRSVLVIVDEAQMIFGDKNAELKGWLSWHRHLGQDIKLIAQHFKMIHQDYYNLADYEIRGKRGFVTSQMVYQWSVNGEVFKTDRIPVNKAVFAAYQSFVGGEVNKGRSKMLLYAAAGVVLAVGLGFYTITWGLSNTFTKGQPKGKKTQAAQVENRPSAGSDRAGSRPAPAPVDQFLEDMKLYSFAGIVGGRVMLQDVRTLAMVSLSDLTEYRLIESSGRGCLVHIPERGLLRLNVRGARYLAASKIQDGGRAPAPSDRARTHGVEQDGKNGT